MAAKVLGTAHIWGVAGTLTNATVQSFTTKEASKNTSAVEDEAGNEIERRYDDSHTEATIEVKIKSGYTMPASGDNLTYATVVYEIVSVDRKEENKAHVIVTLSLLKSANVAYS